MKNCLFCKIIEKDLSSSIVYEDNDVIAILDVNPKTKGHTLIISKEHTESIEELVNEFNLIAKIKIVLQKLKQEYKFDSYNIQINKGEIAGQEIPHLHIHIIPCYKV